MDKIQIYENSATVMLIILISAPRTAGIYSRCEAGSVYEGEPANITCYFGDDIRSLQLDVNVNRFNPEKENIFSCAWFGGVPQINIAPGVTFVGDISNKLTLMIEQVNRERFGGSYKCQVAKSLQQETVPCTLNVNACPQLATNKYVTTGQEKGADTHRGLVIGGVVVGVLVIAALSGLVFVCFWRKKKARKRHDGIVYTVANGKKKHNIDM